MTEPSKVIHVRNVGHEISEALLQMQDVPSAVNALQFYTNVQPSIRYLDYCLRDFVVKAPNRILLVTIHHMLYPITVEVLHQVFSPHGFVEKIVTFQKSAGQLLQPGYGDAGGIYGIQPSGSGAGD
ncbi:hypothetical protein LguiB_010121 [Lonicera macranthoides]